MKTVGAGAVGADCGEANLTPLWPLRPLAQGAHSTVPHALGLVAWLQDPVWPVILHESGTR